MIFLRITSSFAFVPAGKHARVGAAEGHEGPSLEHRVLGRLDKVTSGRGREDDFGLEEPWIQSKMLSLCTGYQPAPGPR